MMCRPLRAVMVGRRYAIIVPEDRSIRFGSRIADPSRRTLASPFFFFSFPLLFPLCLSSTHRGRRERGDATSRTVVRERTSVLPFDGGVLHAPTTLPRALSSRLAAAVAVAVAAAVARLHSIRSGSLPAYALALYDTHTRLLLGKRATGMTVRPLVRVALSSGEERR